MKKYIVAKIDVLRVSYEPIEEQEQHSGSNFGLARLCAKVVWARNNSDFWTLTYISRDL